MGGLLKHIQTFMLVLANSLEGHFVITWAPPPKLTCWRGMPRRCREVLGIHDVGKQIHRQQFLRRHEVTCRTDGPMDREKRSSFVKYDHVARKCSSVTGTSYRQAWLCIAGFWDLQTTSFEIPWFLGLFITMIWRIWRFDMPFVR